MTESEKKELLHSGYEFLGAAKALERELDTWQDKREKFLGDELNKLIESDDDFIVLQEKLLVMAEKLDVL